MEHKYELKEGNGYIKEFYENGCLSFEGEIKNGKKDGKGKIYDEYGHLIFDGNFENGIKKGKGNVYNYNGDLIFEGEFDNNKKIKGKKYEYNEKCELIFYENDEGEKKNFLIKNNYINNIFVNKCIWILNEKRQKKILDNYSAFEGEYKDGKRYKGKEYNKYGELIFEGEYKNGKRYKGKEYNKYGKLIFEGEYKDGKRYKGKE